MTPEGNEESKKAHQLEKQMIKQLTEFHGDTDKITYQKAKNFLDEKIKHEGVEFPEEILEAVFKNTHFDDEG
jgi:hypothetical protein